ncbi:MAG: hypothetical protein ABI761_01500 [Saprospiraceae bacterium]
MKKSCSNITSYMVVFNKFIFFLCVSGFIISCKTYSPPHLPDDDIPMVNGFKSFYQVFHTDSAFQMHHIQFPLEGEPDQSDTIAYTDNYYRYADHWVMHKTFNAPDTLFERAFKLLDSTLIIEVIQHRSSPLRMERRWSLNDNGWQLVYYTPLRIPVKIEIN